MADEIHQDGAQAPVETAAEVAPAPVEAPAASVEEAVEVPSKFKKLVD